jgi:hypothetical protein
MIEAYKNAYESDSDSDEAKELGEKIANAVESVVQDDESR